MAGYSTFLYDSVCMILYDAGTSIAFSEVNTSVVSSDAVVSVSPEVDKFVVYSELVSSVTTSEVSYVLQYENIVYVI